MRAQPGGLLKDAYARARVALKEHREVTGALVAAPVDRGELVGNEIIKSVAPASGGKAVGSAARGLRLAEASPATTQPTPWLASGPLPAPPGRCPGGAGSGPGSDGRQLAYEVPETVNIQLAALSVAVRPGRR